MNQLNQIILEGNVVRIPEKRLTANGKAVCTIPLAVNRAYKTQGGELVKEVSYFDVETFGSNAENCMTRFPTGKPLRITGRLKQDRWKDSEGKSHNKVHIIAERIEFLPIRKPLSEAEWHELQEKHKAQTAAMLAEAAAASNRQQGEEIVF